MTADFPGEDCRRLEARGYGPWNYVTATQVAKQVLSWIAKRRVLIAGVFGICTVIAHDKSRDVW